jgi:hypothetical protein
LAIRAVPAGKAMVSSATREDKKNGCGDPCSALELRSHPTEGFKPASPENGGGGIRTHGDSRLFGFQDRCIKPLCHPSCGLKTNDRDDHWQEARALGHAEIRAKKNRRPDGRRPLEKQPVTGARPDYSSLF